MNPVRSFVLAALAQVACAIPMLARTADSSSADAMSLYDQIQNLRPQANSLLTDDSPPRENVLRAERELTQAWAITQKPSTRELSEGNIFLSQRRFDVARDMANVQALLGRKKEALDWLDAMMSVAWLGGPEISDNLFIKNPHFASLQNEPRFRAMLAILAATDRLQSWPGKTIPYSAQIGEAEQIAGLSMFWSQVRASFVHFDLVPDLDWNQAYLDTLPKVIAAGSTAEYYDILMRFAPLLHDGHTNIYPPEELSAHFYARPPLRTALVAGHVIVTRVRSATLEKLGIRIGDEILAVNGQETRKYAEEHVKPYASSSTKQDLAVRMFDYMFLAGDKDLPIRLTLRAADGVQHDVSLRRSGYQDVTPYPEPAFRMLPGNVAYLPINEFEDDGGLKLLQTSMPRIQASHGLIIDLRENGGGSGSIGLQVLSYLTHRDIPLERSTSIDADALLRARSPSTTIWRVEPDDGYQPERQEKIYEGPVVVLIGPRTFSAAEDFVVSFDSLHRGSLIGEATGGSTGQPMSFAIPGGGMARVCVKRDTYPDGREFVGLGIQPTIEIEPTVDDIRAGRDSVLERARIEILKPSR